MSVRYTLQERRRQAERTRRRIIWGCIHAAIFSVSVGLILSRADRIQQFFQMALHPAPPQPVAVEQPPAVTLSPPVVRREHRPVVTPPRERTQLASASRSAENRGPERSLGDLLKPAMVDESAEASPGWRLVFDFDSGEGSVEIPGDVDASLLAIDSTEGVNVDTQSSGLPVAVDNAVLSLHGAEAVQFEFDVDPAASPGESTKVTMRATSRNLAGKEVSFRRRVAEAAIRSQTRVVTKAAERLAIAVAQHQKVTAWLNSTGTKALVARGAAKNQEATLERTIAGLRNVLATQQQILLAYQASAELGESMDGAATFVLRERPAKKDQPTF